MAFPFAVREATPMVIAISHDVKTKEGFVSLAAKLNSNFDGKLMLPSQGNPVATLVGSHRYRNTRGNVSGGKGCLIHAAYQTTTPPRATQYSTQYSGGGGI